MKRHRFGPLITSETHQGRTTPRTSLVRRVPLPPPRKRIKYEQVENVRWREKRQQTAFAGFTYYDNDDDGDDDDVVARQDFIVMHGYYYARVFYFSPNKNTAINYDNHLNRKWRRL